MIPWKFFDLTARDQTGVLLLSIHRMSTRTLNNVSIDQLLFTVPSENALLLTSYSIEADSAGLNATPLTSELQVRDSSGNTVSSLVQSFNTTWTTVASISQLSANTHVGSPILVAGPGMQIWGRVRFQIAHATNHLQHAMNGILIPRGTMAYQT